MVFLAVVWTDFYRVFYSFDDARVMLTFIVLGAVGIGALITYQPLFIGLFILLMLPFVIGQAVDLIRYFAKAYKEAVEIRKITK